MNLHPRHDQVSRAGLTIKEDICATVVKYGLTFAELIGILAEVIASWTKSEIREERGK